MKMYMKDMYGKENVYRENVYEVKLIFDRI